AWQTEVVEPLRRVRQQWRQAAADDPQLAGLREQIKGVELAAERILLERLEGLCEHGVPTPERGADWLQWLATDASANHDALHRLRVVMGSTQDAE
ncbi:DUF2390 domain-containing protein, partial [Pseudomonas sp. BJa3]|uniref:DUF2390 domain-containing protein n=1 Tax=Pseudomonas sp. BJa3 TaxID=2986525 RepID=UPI00226596BD